LTLYHKMLKLNRDACLKMYELFYESKNADELLEFTHLYL